MPHYSGVTLQYSMMQHTKQNNLCKQTQNQAKITKTTPLLYSVGMRRDFGRGGGGHHDVNRKKKKEEDDLDMIPSSLPASLQRLSAQLMLCLDQSIRAFKCISAAHVS